MIRPPDLLTSSKLWVARMTAVPRALMFFRDKLALAHRKHNVGEDHLMVERDGDMVEPHHPRPIVMHGLTFGVHRVLRLLPAMEAASRIAAIMLPGSAFPFPAISNAVP